MSKLRLLLWVFFIFLLFCNFQWFCQCCVTSSFGLYLSLNENVTTQSNGFINWLRKMDRCICHALACNLLMWIWDERCSFTPIKYLANWKQKKNGNDFHFVLHSLQSFNTSCNFNLLSILTLQQIGISLV